jgi:hypothetical protein
MKTIQFIEDREFDYGAGIVLHKAGDRVELRDDKAQRWVTRGAAVYVGDTDVKRPVDESKEPVNDNPVDGSADLQGQDSGGTGERPVDEPKGSQPVQQTKGRGRRQ